MTWLWSKKLYFVHAAATLVIFLTPSVQAFAATHKGPASAILIAWGVALHWADGKK